MKSRGVRAHIEPPVSDDELMAALRSLAFVRGCQLNDRTPSRGNSNDK